MSKAPWKNHVFNHGFSGYSRGCRCDVCKLASSLHSKRFREEFRAKTDAIKLERGCRDCGYRVDPCALDFDHLGEKSFQISIAWGRKWDSVLAEMDKCEVVCANCHRIRTDVRRRVLSYIDS